MIFKMSLISKQLNVGLQGRNGTKENLEWAILSGIRLSMKYILRWQEVRLFEGLG